MKAELGVFLLSHKRPDYIQATIESILNQSFNSFELIISENSPDDSVVEVLKKYTSDPRIVIVKRNPVLASLDHFNTVIKEAAQYDYVMIFHDDDILKPDAISKMMKLLKNNKSYSAIACNAVIIKNEVVTSQIFSPYFTQDVEIKNSQQLIKRYILKTLGHPPFPSYIYNTKFLHGLSLHHDDGGKYSDTSFLMKIVQRAPFYWLAEPLMEYRQHAHNDSAQLNLKNIRSLCFYFLKVHPELFLLIGFYYFKQIVKKILMKSKSFYAKQYD